MIIKLNVDGFKSLNKFSISFNQGINAIIGPNGAGKTNIIQAFGLVSAIVKGELSDYFISLGGPNAVFNLNRKNKKIRIYCEGRLEEDKKKRKVKLIYKYHITVTLKDKLYIKNEKLVVSLSTKSNPNQRLLEIIRLGEKKFKLHVFNTKLIGDVALSQIKKGKAHISTHNNFPRTNLWSFASLLISYCHLIRRDIAASTSLKINPFIAKLPSDICESSNMTNDGKYLSNAIYYLYSNNKNVMGKINQFISQINPNYKNIKPTAPQGSTIRTFSLIDNKGMECPASNLSDGTIKIVGLLVGILTREHNNVLIEEPENYLHPWVCQILIDYLRDVYKNKICILTTHSETILNSVKPSEIIICENKEGNTKIARIKNIRRLERTIALSGFGCGYHYVAGSISGVPL